MFNEKPPFIENKDQEPFDIEKWLVSELPRQYEEKAKTLNRLGLLEILPEKKEIGLTGINGKEYPIPKPEDIEKIIRENTELYEAKMKQGFTEMEIVPFGLPLEQRLIKIAEKTILKHHQANKLFYARKNPEDEAEQLVPAELDENQPLYFWNGYQNADADGKLVYFPEEFSQNHRGRTKEQILEETGQGFQVILREKNINIPREGQGETIGGRKQLETNLTPSQYLKKIQTEKQYQNEQGQTSEDWLTIFLAHLEKYNQVIDDYQSNGSIAFNLGGYFPSNGNVPHAYWYRSSRRAYLNGNNPGDRNGNYGVRGRVRVL